MSVDIVGRLRFIRSRHKLSQRELAKRSGVTNSTISLIESNQMNPSVGALKRILDGVPMGMAEFFALEPDRPRKVFYRSDELTEIGKKPISYRQVGDNLFGRALQILKERYEPGSIVGKGVFGFLGVTDLEIVLAEGLGIPDQRDKAMQGALQAVTQLNTAPLSRAA